MERRRLGRLGHESSVLIYGGAALSDVTQQGADASANAALPAGINHFHPAARYGDSALPPRPGLPPTPPRDRFGVCHRLEHYEPGHLAEIVRRSARILEIATTQPVARPTSSTPLSRSSWTARPRTRPPSP